MRTRKSQTRTAGEGGQDAQAVLRDRILCAAFDSFMAKGFHGTSTLDIATRAKVSKRELYALFRDKEEMFAAGIAARVQTWRQPLELPRANDAASLEAILVQWAMGMMREVSKPHVVAVHRLAAAEAVRSPEVSRILNQEGRDPTRQALVAFLEDVVASGLLPGVDATEMADELVAFMWRGGLFVRLILGSAKAPSEAEIERRARSAARAVLTLHPPIKRRAARAL